MNAAVIQNGALEIWDVPVPKPGPYEVLCRMEYGSTCAGTDIHLMDGQHPYPVTFPAARRKPPIARSSTSMLARGCPASLLPWPKSPATPSTAQRRPCSRRRWASAQRRLCSQRRWASFPSLRVCAAFLARASLGV